MATRTIWVNPGDANDSIIFNDDAAVAQFYRFLIETGFECTITRDSTLARTVLTLSGGTFRGVLDLNGNGEIWSRGDLLLLLDSDGGGSNKLIVRGSSGTNALEVTEAGRVGAQADYGYISAKTRSRVVYADGARNWFRDDLATSPVIWYSGGPGSWLHGYLRAESLSQPNAQAAIPLNLPDGATVTNWSMQYRKTAQAGGQQRFATAQLLRYPQFGTVSTNESTLSSMSIPNGEGTTQNGTKTAAVTPTFVVDNQQYAYGIGVFFTNTDSGNDGADGLGIAGFKIDYTLLDLKF